MNIPDLTKLNDEIKEMINPNNKDIIKGYTKQLIQAEDELKKKINYSEIKKLQHVIAELKEKIENIENGNYFMEYVSLSNQILNEYSNDDTKHSARKLSPTIQILDTIHKLSPKILKVSSTAKIEKNTKCLVKLLSAAKKYVDIHDLENKYAFNKEDVSNTIKKKFFVECCQNCKSDNGLISSRGMILCKKCGYQTAQFINTESVVSEFSSTERVNTKQRYKYERLKHFEDAMDKFQGKCKKKLPSDLFSKLKKELDIYNLIDHKCKGDRIKKYEKVNKTHIRKFLKNTNNSKYYEDVNYIYNKITGKPVPDISEYINVLREDFKKLLDAHAIVKKKKDRTNFLNGQFVLYQLLRKNGYKCTENDFVMLKARDKREDHNEIYEQCCLSLGWEFYPINFLK